MLEVDCSACAGAQDMQNKRCMSGIVHILSSETLPQTIVLKRHTHKRYRERSLRGAFDAARHLALLNRTSTNTDYASDEGCRTCSASVPRIASVLRKILLEDPVRYTSEPAASVARVRMGLGKGAACGKRASCVASALDNLGRLPEVG